MDIGPGRISPEGIERNAVMILSVLRVLVGFVLACCAAGIVQIGFAAPNTLFTDDVGKLSDAAIPVLLTATHSAVFSAPFALVAAAIGEWQSIRGIVFYVLSGIAIAVAGFIALFSGEAAGPRSIVNQYAVFAYLSAGLAGGLVYWLCAGRFAGDPEDYAMQVRNRSSQMMDDGTPIETGGAAKAGRV
jgi:hypothetical protein